jgi:hypothetical protein
VSDSREPGARGCVAPVAREAAKRAKEDFLREVFGVLDADGPNHPPKHALRMVLDEFVEGPVIPSSRTEKELLIRAFLQAPVRPKLLKFSAEASENPVKNLRNERKTAGQSALTFGLHSFLC